MYLAVLGRQPEISIAELEALFSDVKQISPLLAVFKSQNLILPDINRLGGSLKIAKKLEQKPLDFLSNLPSGKITIGLSDYSKNASPKSATLEALKLKKILVRHGRSVRVVENKTVALSTATSLHNGLSGKNERKVELIKVDNDWYKVVGVQDIEAYAERDQARPARDAKVGMLPPKLAQILINLCGPLRSNARVLDPFCGTGVVLQEALLMGYCAYGTDINERMIDYSKKNLRWLIKKSFTWTGDGDGRGPQNVLRSKNFGEGESPAGPVQNESFELSVGDATSFKWNPPIDAIACEGYLGQPMSQIPAEIKLKQQKQECSTIILGFLKNLASQIEANTPVVIAVPAWLRENNKYERLDILDEIALMGYNVNNKSREGLIYCREKQIVARDIIILRKK